MVFKLFPGVIKGKKGTKNVGQQRRRERRELKMAKTIWA